MVGVISGVPNVNITSLSYMVDLEEVLYTPELIIIIFDVTGQKVRFSF